MLFDAGILDREPKWDQRHALVLAHTPGIPLEWIYAALRLGEVRRAQLVAMVRNTPDGEWRDYGLKNAESIVAGDGWKMLEAVCPRYAGPAPLWSQFDLQNSRRSDAANAALLSVNRKKVWRWRVNAIFDPLTGVRLVPNRGTRIIA
jgi:hypothetical protein